MFYHRILHFTSKSQVLTSIKEGMMLKLNKSACFGNLESMKNRSYYQFCALAYALDAVGERWTLLIIRELLTGPRRYTDLMEGLPGISTNLLSERLKSLEGRGIIIRRILPPPAASTVYELTPFGQSLENAVIELGRWGSQLLPPSLEGVALPSLGAATIAIKAFFRPAQAQGPNETYELHLDNEILQIQIKNGELQAHQGQSLPADVVFYTSMDIFMGLFSGQIPPDDAVANELIRIEGDPDALHRFLNVTGVPA
jgi:DNA-binding HxlR family transcriptional regulator